MKSCTFSQFFFVNLPRNKLNPDNQSMKIFIAEDEPLAAAKLKVFLEKLGEGSDISLFDNGISAMAALLDEKPDLLFLDIQMPGLTGMQILERLSSAGNNGKPCVVITSAYDQYAIDSFSYDVTDYLLKPYTLERLGIAIQKATKRLHLQELENKVSASTLTVRYDGKSEIVPTSEIIGLEALKDYVRITLASGRKLTTLATMSNLMEQLPEHDFARIHRSYIVNLKAITTINSQSVILSDGSEMPIGKTYKKLLKQP